MADILKCGTVHVVLVGGAIIQGINVDGHIIFGYQQLVYLVCLVMKFGNS